MAAHSVAEAEIVAGGFAEPFFCYYEDVDLALRLRRAGWIAVQTPMARVRHVGSASAPTDFVRRHATRNRLWTLARGMPGPLLAVGLPLALALALAGAAAGLATGGGRVRLAATVEALRGLPPRLAERRSGRVGSVGIARALSWSPVAYLRRAIDLRRVADLPERVAEPPVSRAHVVAVIVSHDPDVRVQAVVDSALGQCRAVVLIDNRSKPATAEWLRELAGARPRLTLIENAENRGLAAAQNQGIATARAMGADWILLLDDDSVPAEDMVGTMLGCWTGLADRRRVGLLTPRLTDTEETLKPRLLTARNRFALRHTPLVPGSVARHGLFAIASGSLIRTAVLEVVGDMAEDYFIDYVDIEFSLRLRRAGFEIVGVGDAVLRHRLGEFQATGPNAGLNTHSAWRRRYIHRNRVRVWRAHGAAAPGWLAWDMAAAGYDIWKALRHETDKTAKLRAIGSGLLAGLLGRP